MQNKATRVVLFLLLSFMSSLDSSGHSFFEKFKENSIPNFFGKNTTTGKFCVQNSFVVSIFASKTCLTSLRRYNRRRADTGDFILIDTKNYASLASIFKGANINQLKAYLSAITSMNKLKIIQVNRSAFGANTALSTLRKNLQKVYQDNADDFFSIFWNNISLRSQLGLHPTDIIIGRSDFNTLINIDLKNNSNALFNYIDIKIL